MASARAHPMAPGSGVGIKGQDTTYYGGYIRNKVLANGAKDGPLRHLYQCRRTFGSQAGLLGGSLAPLAVGGAPAAPARAPRRPGEPAARRPQRSAY
ncbi:hypothetical protein IC235_02970 [Hymenobacter sp. BT664]|uniref:Uncharacterized protein n=1 Tax=Hymenobacter montanus TaxID=2771359 RepID=A0A927B9X8_9BACT|nr:hypothetical protein [Hymenobacter montanus]MBD2766852.1 hypothetical protein [Hymenobacter montanus]